jgi:hypothetical protein
MPSPTIAIGPTLRLFGWLRKRHQSRRKVKLTVHRANRMLAMASVGGGPTVTADEECYFVTVTNASRDGDIVITHVWLDTEPPVQVVEKTAASTSTAEMETIVCALCGVTFLRLRTTGRKPHLCPACRNAGANILGADLVAVGDYSGNVRRVMGA